MGGCLSCLRSPNMPANVVRSSTSGPHSTPAGSSSIPPPPPAPPPLLYSSSYPLPDPRGIEEMDENEILIHSQTIGAKSFTFQELASSTNNFSGENLIGEGGFGQVYKGQLESTGQVVAIKMLDIDGIQGSREFVVEVLMLTHLQHENLVKLMGYCVEGEQRILVYEFMPLGSLDDHLYGFGEGDKRPLDWNTRIKIARGAAKGLKYLHHETHPPVIVRDFKSANILLNEEYKPKISDLGFAKLGPVDSKTNVTTRVMGTRGYCAPDYAMTGQLTVKSDVYSFGVVLLELITGREAIEDTQDAGVRNLVEWAKPLLVDWRRHVEMVDPLLEGRYPSNCLYPVLEIAAMCLQDNAASRPSMEEIVNNLDCVASHVFDPNEGNSGIGTSKIKGINWSDVRKQFRNQWQREQPDEAGPS